MPNTPQKSFIPRQGTATKRRQGASRRVYVFTVLCYFLLFSTLIATGAVFIYGRVIDAQLEDEIVALNEAIGVFNQEEMNKVRDFDIRLRQAQFRIDNSVSAASIFTALEAATVRTVQISELTLERMADTEFVLNANVITDGFDSSIFQRGIFERNDVIESVKIENLALGQETTGEGQIIAAGSQVAFTARLGVPLTKVPFIPNQSTPAPVPVTPPVSTEATSTSTDNELSTSSAALPANTITP